MAKTKLPEDERVHWARAALDFVRSIGLRVEESSAPELASTFVPGVRIVDGGLVIDTSIVYPGDILHEAGHIATMPAKFRPKANGTLGAVFREMGQYLEANPSKLGAWPEDPVCRAILQCGEAEAAAWQYAAAQHIDMPAKWLFPKGSFNGNSKDTLLRLQANSYFGINGLQAAGWTRVREMGDTRFPLYPKLAFWLHGGA